MFRRRAAWILAGCVMADLIGIVVSASVYSWIQDTAAHRSYWPAWVALVIPLALTAVALIVIANAWSSLAAAAKKEHNHGSQRNWDC
jgi:hypothetical protein